MELVEGETLAERLTRGALGVDASLGVAGQLAEALEAAHQKGIIHRDLKPANIKIAPDGKVKVLDFGLAKIFEDALPSLDAANSPTSLGGTAAGLVLGTAAYMSPEQARGAPVDKRTDIWALGCVLFEMLAGKPHLPPGTCRTRLPRSCVASRTGAGSLKTRPGGFACCSAGACERIHGNGCTTQRMCGSSSPMPMWKRRTRHGMRRPLSFSVSRRLPWHSWLAPSSRARSGGFASGFHTKRHSPPI